VEPSLPHWLRALLAPAGLAYRAGVSARNSLYRSHRLPIHRIDVPVISVGNLVTGGSGKTPFVAYLAARLRELGRRVAVVSGGYGGAPRHRPFVVSDGAGQIGSFEEGGDEPVLLAELLPGIPVIVDRDRVAAARVARHRFGSDLILLDDGFQHRRLHRDLDLLLSDARDGFGNARMLPFGPLREPISEIARAGAFLMTGREEELREGERRFRELAQGLGVTAPLFLCERRIDGLYRSDGGPRVDAASLSGLKALAFSGIARPESFESDLRGSGIRIAEALRFRDHQRYRHGSIRRIESALGRSGADVLITTEKDRVRLGWTRFPVPLFTLRIRMAPQDEETLLSFLRERLAYPAAASPATSR